MKILQLVSSLGIGGAERFVSDLSIELMKNDNSVVLLVLDEAKNVGKDPDYERTLLNELKKHKLEVVFVGRRGRKNPISVYLSLKKVLNDFNPDVVHSHLLIWSLLLSLFNKDFVHIFTQHINRLKFPLIHKYWLNSKIDKYISICDEASDSFSKVLVKNKIVKIVNGVDLSRFEFKTRPKNANDVISFVTISRLTYQKNLDLVIEAVYDLSSYDPELEFKVNIVGQGPLENDLFEKVNDLKLNKYFNFLGTRHDISNILSQSDVFLLPSRFEGFSIALIEALSSNIDIIASDVGGNAEILNYGEFGTIIEKENKNALIGEMRNRIVYGVQIKEKDKLKEHLKSLSIEFSAQQHFNLYNRFLAK